VISYRIDYTILLYLIITDNLSGILHVLVAPIISHRKMKKTQLPKASLIQNSSNKFNVFEELVYSFASLVLTTQHNMKMMFSDLNNVNDYMDIMVDALGLN
jgi:hypothetical protein